MFVHIEQSAFLLRKKVSFSIYQTIKGTTKKTYDVQLYTLVQCTYSTTSIQNLNNIFSQNYNTRKWHYLQLFY
jgi:hypothetical protein